MTLIYLETLIDAPLEICFNSARNIDLHEVSTAQTKEKAIAGKTSGLIEKGEFVTWEATHFGVKQRLTVHITEMQYPVFFCDEMLKGAFKSMKHEHHFQEKDGKTLMIDRFQYETPFWLAGRLFDRLVLQRYMKTFLLKRNSIIKTFSEGAVN